MESDLSPLEWPNGPTVHLHESSSFLTEKKITPICSQMGTVLFSRSPESFILTAQPPGPRQGSWVVLIQVQNY